MKVDMPLKKKKKTTESSIGYRDFSFYFISHFSQSAGAVEYTDCFSAEG